MTSPFKAAMMQADKNFAQLFGHRLFTLTALAPEGNYVLRLYSSQQAAYEQQGTKPVLRNDWYKQVIEEASVFRGSVIEDVMDYFPDHKALSDMGLGAVINCPVCHEGRVIGTVNLLDRGHAYDETDLQSVYDEAQKLADLFLGCQDLFAAQPFSSSGEETGAKA
ncbi:MAG: GAF domain-containing protein [Cohaesibacter sp.]|nr:GAF domain-containing protein [Cohaesibacter sp.]